jgi:hypothetical protein
MKKIYLLGLWLGLATAAFAAEPLPYERDFVSQGIDGWTTVNSNNDNYTWEEFNGYGVYVFTSNSSADDWLVSPELSLEGGVAYQITIDKTPFTGFDSRSIIEVYIGQGDDVSAYKSIGRLDLSTDQPDVLYFSVDHSEEYHFALHNQCYFGSTWFVKKIAIEPRPVGPSDPDVRYEFDFDDLGVSTGWTIIDNNKDENTWSFVDGQPGISLPMSFGTPQNDWLISPAVALESGKSYIVSYRMSANGGISPETATVAWGKSASPEALTSVLANESVNAGEEYTRYFRITPTESGSYYFGFQGTSEAFNGMLTVHALKVANSNGVVPLAPTDFVAQPDIRSGKVSLSWVNADMDTENIAITRAVKTAVYRDDVQIAIVDGNAGGTSTYEDSPEDYSGEVTYSVKSFVGEGEKSEPAEAVVSLDDFQGEEKLLYTWGGTGNASFEEWTIHNEDGGTTWQYQSWENSYLLYYGKPRIDWLISPAIQMAKNRRYIVEVETRTGLTASFRLSLTLGASATPSGQQDSLMVWTPYGNGSVLTRTEQFSVDSDGDYHLGILCSESLTSSTLLSVRLYYYENTEVPSLEIPYTNDFEEENALAGWRLKDGTSFEVTGDSPNRSLVSSADVARDEYVFGPMFPFKAGVRYEVSLSHVFDTETSNRNFFAFYMSRGQSQSELLDDTFTLMEGEGTMRYVFVPEEDGTYCPAFRLVTAGAGTASVDNMKVGCRIHMAAPYQEDFSSYEEGTAALGWNGGTVAVENKPSLASFGNVLKINDTWLESPVFTHDQMKDTYILSFLATADEVCDIMIEQMVIESDGDEFTYDLEPSASISSADKYSEFSYELPRYSDTEPYLYCITMYVPNGKNVRIDNVKLSMKERSLTAAAPVNFRVSNVSENFSFQWSNPTLDVDGETLNRDVTVRIYQYGKDEVLAEVTGEPGENMSYRVSADGWTNGVAIFRAEASCGDTKGRSATAVIYQSTDTRIAGEVATFDFSADEAWEKTGDWSETDDNDGLYVSQNASLLSPAVAVREGKTYIVRYRFATTSDLSSSFAIGFGGKEQKFENVFLGKTLADDYYEFSFDVTAGADGQEPVSIRVDDVQGSVTVKSVDVFEVREYPSECTLPYENNFDDLAIRSGIIEPNWTISYATIPWKIEEITHPAIASSGNRALVAPECVVANRMEMIYTPLFTFVKGKSYEIAFDYFIEGANSGLTLVYAFAPTKEEGSYAEIATIPGSEMTGWSRFSYPLVVENADMTCTFGFVAYATSANDGIIAIDNLHIGEKDVDSVNDVDIHSAIYYGGGLLHVSSDVSKLAVFDMQGRAVFMTDETGDISLDALPGGFYLVKGQKSDGSVCVVKVVK